MQTKEVDIVWNGKPEKVVIKRFTFGEFAKLRKEVRKITWQGSTQHMDIDEEKLLIRTLLYGISNAPFQIDENTIKNLDKTTGEKLYNEIDSFNTLDEGKKNEPAHGNQDRIQPEGGSQGDADVLPDGEGAGNEAVGG